MNQSLFTAKVSYLPRVDGKDEQLQTISLGRALVSDTWRAQVEAVRAETDPARQAALKKALPCFTPSGTFAHISRAGLIKHSGFISIDIDCKPDKGINPGLLDYDLKAAVAAVPHIAYCGRSCRGAGYVVVIPIADPSKHLDYFRALAFHFKRAGLDIDPACRDICRKRFVSWDPDPYINTAARPWALTLPEREHAPGEPTPADLEETAAQVEAVLAEIEAHRWDITADRREWVRILGALAGTFQESGRTYAHRISAFYPGYTPEETDSTYSYFVAHPAADLSISTFFYIARREIGKHDFDELLQ